MAKVKLRQGITMVGDTVNEQSAYVCLVWGITADGRCDLIAVAAREESRERYEDHARRSRNPMYKNVLSELVLIDHLFGASMMPNKLHRKFSPQMGG